jgi:hypothetical protein
MLAATALTAAFTGVLAALAAVTAWYARKAFRSQAQAVTTLRDQLKDQQVLNVKQAPVLELQARELRESLDERKRAAAEREREAAELRRAQASRVFMWGNATSAFRRARAPDLQQPPQRRKAATCQSPPSWLMSRTAATSHIYDAEFDCHRGTARYGSHNPESLGTIMPGDGTSKERVPPLRTNLEVSGAVVRFTDATGITWLRRPDGELFEQRQQ